MTLAPDRNVLTDELTRRDRLAAVAQLLPSTDVTPAPLQQFIDEVAALVGAPCAGLSVILQDAGILAATHGVDGWLAEAGGMPAHWAPCAVVVCRDSPLLIADTYDDPAHTTNPLVTITGVRSYAGVPLHLDGQAVGSLCVLDGRPAMFSDAVLDTLTGLAPRAVALLHATARA